MKKIRNIEEYKNKKIVWDSEFIQLDKNGNEYPLISKQNLISLLKHYNILVRFNLLTKKMEVESKFRNVSSDNLNSFVVDIKDLITKHKFKGELSINRITGILESIAWEKKFNPIKNYFDSLDYKNNNKFDEVYKVFDLLPLKFEKNKKFYFKMFIKWLRHFIIPHFESEFRPQLCLIIKGKQRTGKSTFFRNLIPEHLRIQYFHDKQLNLDSKDSLTECTTKMLVEIGELGDSFKDINKIKMFMTQDKDELRTPYATYANIHKRMTVFSGTVNDDEFLRDETGNTRFPVLEIDKPLNFEKLNNIDIDKFWSEILYNYFHVSKIHYLESEEIELINEINKRYKKYSYELSLLESVFDLESNKTKFWLRSGDIWKILGKQQKVSKNRLTRELKNRNILSKEKNKQAYFALNKPALSDLPKDFLWDFEIACVCEETKNEKSNESVISNVMKYIKTIIDDVELNYFEKSVKEIYKNNDFQEIQEYINSRREQIKSNRGTKLHNIVQCNINKNNNDDFKKINSVKELKNINDDISFEEFTNENIVKLPFSRTYDKNIAKTFYFKNDVLILPEFKQKYYKESQEKLFQKYKFVSGSTLLETAKKVLADTRP